jgi:hypothetical protein
MQVKVMFLDAETNQFEHVATVTVNKAYSGSIEDEKDACEFAFLRTQNIFGSWSQGPYFNKPTCVETNIDTRCFSDEVNEDYSACVEVVKPLEDNWFGATCFGHRSSMVGDRFIVNDNIYICRGVGFSLYDENLAKQFS